MSTVQRRLFCVLLTNIGAFLFFTIFCVASTLVLFKNALDLYMHPLQVTRAVLTANSQILTMHRDMKDVVLSTNQAEMDYAIRRVNETEKEVRVQLSIVEDNILGQEGLNLVGTARRAFEDWKYIRNEVIALMHCNNVSDAVAITQGKGWLHVQTLENNMSALINYANSSATNMVSSSHEINTVLFVGVSFLSVVMMVIDIALFVTMVRAIVRGLSALGSSILKESEKGSVGYVEITEPIKKLSDVAVIACEYNKVVQMVHRQIWVKDGIGLLNNEMEVIFRGTHKLSVLVRESLIRMSDHLNMHTCAAYLHEIPERLATSVPSMVTLLTHKRGKYAHLHRAHPRPPASESQQESPDSDNTPPESAANRPPSARQNSSTLCRIPDLRLDSCVVCRRSEVFGIRAASTVFPTRMCEDSHFRPEASISDPVYAHAPAPASASASSSVSGPMCASNPSQSALPDFTGAGRIEHFARARLGGRSGHFGLHGHGIDETYLLPQTGRTATTATTATAATTARSVTTQSVHVPSASDSFLFPNPPHHGPSPSPPRRAPPTLDDARVLMELSDDPMSDEGFEHEENPFPREEANLVYQEGCTPRTCIAGRCIGKQLNLAHRSNPAIAPPPLESEILNVLFARREPIVVVACGGEDLPENKCSKEQRRARHRMLRKQQQDLRTKSRPETPGPMPPTIDLLLTDHSLSPPSEQPSARSSSTHRKAPQAFEAFNLPPPAPPPVQAVPVVPAPDPVRTSPPHVPLLPIPDPDSPSVLRREIQAPWRVFGWGKHDPGYHLLAIPLLDTDLFFGTLVFTTPVHDDNVTLKCVREYTISAAQILTRFVRRHYSEEQMGHLVGYSREINNELLKANCELERRRREVEYAAMMKEQFLCHISHEIRTPLHGVTGLLALLLDGHHAGFTAEQTDLLRLAKDSSDGLLGVIGDVLDLAKIETGRLDLGPIPFEVRPGLRAIVEGFRIRACEKGIEIESEVDASVPEKVVGDKTRLDQVLINLIGNAVKFTSKGHVRVIVTTSPYVDDPENPPPRPVRLELSPVRSDSKDGEDADGGPSSGGGEEEEEEEEIDETMQPPIVLNFTVEDTGIGIKPRDQSRIFDSFYQIDSGNTRQYGGTGLGLAISKRLVRMMGGTLQVTSVPGQGSTFAFSCVLRHILSPLPLSAMNERLPSPLRPLNVLLAEDTPINRIVAERTIGRFNWTMRSAENGQEAVAIWFRTVDADLRESILAEERMRVEEELAAARAGDADEGEDEDADEESVGGEGGGPRGEGEGERGPGLEEAEQPVEHAPIDRSVQELLLLPRLDSPTKSETLLPPAADLETPSAPVTGQDGVSGTGNTEGHEEPEVLPPFDIILMDIQMPIMDGFEATRVIRRREAMLGSGHIPIVALTAHTISGYREKCLRADMDEYLGKPFKKDELTRVCARVRPDLFTFTSPPGAAL